MPDSSNSRRAVALTVLTFAGLVGALIAVPLGLLGFAYQRETALGHGLAGYAVLALTLTGPVAAVSAVRLAARGKPRAVRALVIVVVMYAVWGGLLHAVVHYRIR